MTVKVIVKLLTLLCLYGTILNWPAQIQKSVSARLNRQQPMFKRNYNMRPSTAVHAAYENTFSRPGKMISDRPNYPRVIASRNLVSSSGKTKVDPKYITYWKKIQSNAYSDETRHSRKMRDDKWIKKDKRISESHPKNQSKNSKNVHSKHKHETGSSHRNTYKSEKLHNYDKKQARRGQQKNVSKSRSTSGPVQNNKVQQVSKNVGVHDASSEPANNSLNDNNALIPPVARMAVSPIVNKTIQAIKSNLDSVKNADFLTLGGLALTIGAYAKKRYTKQYWKQYKELEDELNLLNLKRAVQRKQLQSLSLCEDMVGNVLSKSRAIDSRLEYALEVRINAFAEMDLYQNRDVLNAAISKKKVEIREAHNEKEDGGEDQGEEKKEKIKDTKKDEKGGKNRRQRELSLVTGETKEYGVKKEEATVSSNPETAINNS